ncbi:unnamed protein product [Lymnaea stagnalis]|uniref:CCHC NOA-type domain-containing protein n=1 Tax=Lymnaea stagnalis TaxID=6523 RepID=A0AAV2H3B7_LYMST
MAFASPSHQLVTSATILTNNASINYGSNNQQLLGQINTVGGQDQSGPLVRSQLVSNNGTVITSGVQETSDNSSYSGAKTTMMTSGFNLQMSGHDGMRGSKMTDSTPSLTDITLEQAVQKLQEIENENMALRDNLRTHNAVVKKQYEALAEWRKNENDKFEKTKALITALREENQELQVKMMAKNDKEKELLQKVLTLEEEKAHIQRQKAISDQKLFNVHKIAEDQGFRGLPNEDFDAGQEADNLVFVSTSEKEEVIAKMEDDLAAKVEIIDQLRTNLLKVEAELTSNRETMKQLLLDMESQQTLKVTIEEENRQLTQQIIAAEAKLHKQMESWMAMTKREMQAEQMYSNQNAVTKSAQQQSASERFEKGDEALFSFPENVEDLMNIAKSLEAKQKEERTVQALHVELDEYRKKNQSLQEEMEKIKTQFKDLTDQHRETVSLLKEAQAQGKEAADKLSQEYEQKLMEMAKNRPDNRAIQASDTEDMSILRSQVLTLIQEVDEAQNKLSAAMEAINMKDTRIRELDEMNSRLRLDYQRHWQESTTLIQHLRSQINQQSRAEAENLSIKNQHQKLQESFSKLVTDYKELQETFEVYRVQMERQSSYPRQPSKEAMEEINRLTAQVIAGDEAIAYRDEQIEKLKQRSALESQQDEEIQLLKFQADLYKSDFAAEREARTKLAEERTKLLDELQQLQEYNRTLKEELEGYNQRQINDMQRRLRDGSMAGDTADRFRTTVPPSYRHSGSTWNHIQRKHHLPKNRETLRLITERSKDHHMKASRGPRPEEDEELQSFQQFECPKCNAQFPDIDSLQLHVPDCIDQ